MIALCEYQMVIRTWRHGQNLNGTSTNVPDILRKNFVPPKMLPNKLVYKATQMATGLLEAQLRRLKPKLGVLCYQIFDRFEWYSGEFPSD